MKEKKLQITNKKHVIMLALIYVFIVFCFGIVCVIKHKLSLYIRIVIPIAFVYATLFWYSSRVKSNICEAIAFITAILIIVGSFTQILLISHSDARVNAGKYILYGIWRVAEDGELENKIDIQKSTPDGDGETVKVYDSLNNYLKTTSRTGSELKFDINYEDAVRIIEALKEYGLSFRYTKNLTSIDEMWEDDTDLHMLTESEIEKKKVYSKFDILRLSHNPKEIIKENATIATVERLIREYDVFVGDKKITEGGAAYIKDDEATASINFLLQSEKNEPLIKGYEKLLERETAIREVGTKEGYPNQTAYEIAKSMLVGLLLALFFNVVFVLIYGHYSDFVIKLLMIFNIVIFIIMMFKGNSGDGSKVVAFGLELLEFVKLLYVFVITGLLCKKEREKEPFFTSVSILRNLTRKKIARLYIIGNLIGFGVLSEYGTGLVLVATGMFTYVIFGIDFGNTIYKIRSTFFKIKKMGIKKVFKTCANYLRKKIVNHLGSKIVLFSVTIAMIIRYREDIDHNFEKIFNRVKYWINPDADRYNLGNHYIQLRNSLSLSNFKAVSDRYTLYISEQHTDMVFAKLTQMFGVLFAIFLIFIFIVLVLLCFSAAMNTRDTYYSGLALTCTALLAFQTLIHIAYNVRIFPITGIPLMFISKGGMNIAISLTIILIIIQVSTGRMVYDQVTDIESSGISLGSPTKIIHSFKSIGLTFQNFGLFVGVILFEFVVFVLFSNLF